MSCYTDYTLNRVVCGVSFTSKRELQDWVDDARDNFNRLKQRCTALAYMTDPAKFTPEDYSPMEFIEQELREIFDDTDKNLMDYYMDVQEGEYLLAHWEESHHSSGMAYSPHFVPGLECYINGTYVQECDADGFPVIGQKYVTADSEEYDILYAFKYADALKDGTTKAAWEKKHGK